MPALRFRVKICLNLALKFSVVLRQTECCSRKSFFKTLITLEPEVLHRSDASQNDHKSKGYLPDKNVLKRLGYPTFIRLSKIRLNSPSLYSILNWLCENSTCWVYNRTPWAMVPYYGPWPVLTSSSAWLALPSSSLDSSTSFPRGLNRDPVSQSDS